MLSIFWVGLLQLCDLSGFYSAHGFLMERAVHDSHYWITYAIAKLVMFQNIKNPWTKIPTNVLAEGSSLLNLIILMQKPVSDIFGYLTRYGRRHNVRNNFQESPVFILHVRVFFWPIASCKYYIQGNSFEYHGKYYVTFFNIF